MVDVEALEIANISIVDFEMCTAGVRDIRTPAIVLITEVRNQVILMSLLNTSHQFSFTPKPNIRYLFPNKLHIIKSSYYLIDLLLFYEDTFT